MIKRSEKTGLSLDRLRDLIPGKGSASSGPGRATGVPLRLRRLVQPGLQTRFVTTVALVMLCMITVLVAVTVQYQRSTLRHDLERRVEVLAELVASQPLIRQADPSGDGLQDVADFLAEQPDIDFALLLTPDNEVLIDASGSAELVGQTVVDESGVVGAAVAGIDADGTAEPAIREYEGAIHVAQPIVVDGEHVRTVDFAVSLNDVNSKSTSLLIRGLLLGFGFLVIGVAATALLVRRITRPLTQLTEAAEDLSRVQIPALIEQLRSGDVNATLPEVSLIDVDSDDEIGRLGGAFNSIQLTTAEVARSQGELLKRGISDIFVQLARRNQSLIDRQLEVIDDLEASERSPDALAGLFKLDHLAARMRRNAESLLVLADEGSTNVRARPVSMTDMVRVAIGEVEQYHRVEVLGVDDAMVKGAAASGMSHLLAELLDNALRNSPETSRVDVTGQLRGDGYRISVSDQGVGLSADQLGEYNELLQRPPEMGLTLSRSLGFTVVSRLARQFDLRVGLQTSDAGGITAVVDIPAALLGPAGVQAAGVAPPPPAPVAPATEAAPAHGPLSAAGPAPAAHPPRPAPVPPAPQPSVGGSTPGEGSTIDPVPPIPVMSPGPSPVLPTRSADPAPLPAPTASAPLPPPPPPDARLEPMPAPPTPGAAPAMPQRQPGAVAPAPPTAPTAPTAPLPVRGQRPAPMPAPPAAAAPPPTAPSPVRSPQPEPMGAPPPAAAPQPPAGGSPQLPTRRPAPQPTPGGPAFPATESVVPAPVAASPMVGIAQRQAPQARSPEQLRQMLNNYRRGQARSRGADGSQEVTDD